MIVLKTSALNWNPKTRTFPGEISCLFPEFNPASEITIFNPKTKKRKIYHFSHADKDNTSEDTFGWNYENKESNTKLLIIND